MSKKTKLLIYVDADVMSNPAQLFEVAITHMIKKDVDIGQRRQFIVEYQKAVRQAKDPIAMIHEWLQVRDVASFPFRNKQEGIADESEGAEGGVSVDEGTDGEEVNGEAPRDGDDHGNGEGDTGDKRKRNK